MSNITDAMALLHFAAERLRANPYGFLITVNTASPRARLVQPLHVDDAATISIGTSPRSRKVALPGRPGEHLRQRTAQPLVSVGDDQLHAAQPTSRQAAAEL